MNKSASSGFSPSVHWQVLNELNETASMVRLRFDLKGKKTNVLSAAALLELEAVLIQLEKHPPQALVIDSAKTSGFIAGADVHEFSVLKTPQQAMTLIERGQKVLNRLQNFPAITLCLIDGHCLGGGLELALACQSRIASDRAQTRLGLPEVRLGIHPGFGGTVRLPECVGEMAALRMMLSGKSVSAQAAKRLHLVAEVVPPRQLLVAAKQKVAQIKSQTPAHRKSFSHYLLASHMVRHLVAWQVLRDINRRDPYAHYPAPRQLLKLWCGQTSGSQKQKLQAEGRSVADLVTTEAAQQLVRIFHLRERLKSTAGAVPFVGRRVHVIGAGIMGADIAAWCALQGFDVSLQDTRQDALSAALKHANALFNKLEKIPVLRRAALDRFLLDASGATLNSADLVIEAIYENQAAKQALYADIEQKVAATTLIATNTSSIPLHDLAANMQHPERFIGLHFFNPVAKMPLIEVVRGPKSTRHTQQQAAAFVVALKKLPLAVTSTPGFLVNRVLMPYLLQALTMVQEGSDPQAIDQAALAYGMPVGPVALADQVGLDICLSVATILSEHGQAVRIPEGLSQRVKAGQLGCKSGQGFYRYQHGKRQPASHTMAVDLALQQRVMMPLLNEVQTCLQEGVVENADCLDAGMIFGTGFAPFRGGPMQALSQ